ncbi:hypothetical protein MMC31_004234, partial [Peltigera leucophlebia]|nr:hypothetical protein [Peltigera leucophlebia]
MPNFSNCSETFIRAVRLNLSEVTQFRYNGPVVGPLSNIENSHRTMITLVGCRKICGTGSDYYEWKDSSATITTWVLPVIGLLLQAPYESNEFWRTLRALARWLGNPVASLSYTLWNIKVTSKCALMVDMATKYEHIPGLYDEVSPGQRSQFSQIRDSMYILSVMNQYEIKRRMPSIEAEKLLRVALFSDSLKLTADENTSGLIQKRYELATLIRKGRKKGVVPVFISLLWFIFSLALSIQQAYGDLGANRTAHNMALGCLLSWLPVLILTGIVDRNPVAADSILLELNSFLDEVRSALLDVDLRAAYIQDTSKHQDDFAWTTALDSEDYFHQDFFTEFSGQGRLRWHYGVAQPIIASIEGSFMAAAGRNWLKDAELARTKMILGPEKKFGLRWFDFRMLWQIIGSICIMLDFTPTVGLGCRSGGYLIFGVITFAISLVEFLVWCLVKDDTASPGWLRKHTQEYPLALLSSRIERHLSRSNSQNWAPYMLSKLGFRQFLRWYNSLSFKDRIAIFILDPSEAINAGWLVYIVIAQTFGWYQNCNCMASIWGSRGGYIDFASYEIYLANGVGVYWGFGI